MTRYEITRKAYENKEIEADTFGQLHMGNFTNETILDAVERHWIDAEFAAHLLDADLSAPRRMIAHPMRAGRQPVETTWQPARQGRGKPRQHERTRFMGPGIRNHPE